MIRDKVVMGYMDFQEPHKKMIVRFTCRNEEREPLNRVERP